MDDEELRALLRDILWKNVETLMQRDFGGENLNKVALAANFAPANMTRIKARDTDVTFKVLIPLARAFNMPAWQLLTPDLGAQLYLIQDGRVVPLFTPPPKPAGALPAKKEAKVDERFKTGHGIKRAKSRNATHKRKTS